MKTSTLLRLTAKVAVVFAFLFLISTPFTTFAQNNNKATAATPGVSATASDSAQPIKFEPLTALPGIKDAVSASTLPNFLNQLYKIMIGAGAVLAVIMIMVAGVQIMTSSGSVTSNEKAKSRIQNAILGLVLILAPTIVFGIINPDILKLNLDVSALQTKLNSNYDVSSPSTSSEAKVCSSIVKKQTVPLPSGKDAASVCSAIGKGWAHYSDTCCAISDTKNTCCGYDPANDQTPSKPISDPTTDKGNFTVDYYYQDTNYDTGEKCTIENTAHYTSKSTCTSAANTFSRQPGLRALGNNCNTDDSKLTSATLAKPLPASSYTTLSKLPLCPNS